MQEKTITMDHEQYLMYEKDSKELQSIKQKNTKYLTINHIIDNLTFRYNFLPYKNTVRTETVSYDTTLELNQSIEIAFSVLPQVVELSKENTKLKKSVCDIMNRSLIKRIFNRKP